MTIDLVGVRRRGGAASALLILLLLVLPVLGDRAAVAAPGEGHVTGVVSGTTTGGASAPAAGVTVSLDVEDPDTGAYEPSGLSTETDATGAYDLAEVPDGRYRVHFTDAQGRFLSQWWRNTVDAAGARPVRVVAGSTVRGVTARLAPSAHITGTVTDTGGTPLAGAQVTAYESDGDGGFDDVAVATTASDGGYDVSGLVAGAYRVRFLASGHVGEYWDDQPRLRDAADVVVASGETVSGHDARLDRGASISGVVRGPGGVAVANTSIEVYELDRDDGSWARRTTLYVGQDGTYAAALGEGTYRLYVNAFNTRSPVLASEWWHDRAGFEQADDVVLARGTDLTGIDPVLGTGAHITGRVTTTSGAPASGLTVQALQREPGSRYWTTVRSTVVQGSGTYDLAELGAGKYRLRFGGNSAYLEEYWMDAATVESAADVVVGRTGTVSGKDAVVTPASRITGSVTDPAGSPVSNIAVSAYRLASDGQWTRVVEASPGFTSSSGTYEVRGLPAGTYRIGFRDQDDRYVDEFWDDALTVQEAADVTVGASTTVFERNAVLAPVGAAQVTGTITGVDGHPVTSAYVYAYARDPATGEWTAVGSQYTDQDGRYALRVRPGTYRFSAYDYLGNHVRAHWGGGETVDEATDLVVPPSSVTPGIDLVMPAAAHITGRIDYPGGVLRTILLATAYTFDEEAGDWVSVGTYSTGQGGRFDVGGLEAGTYRIGFSQYAGAGGLATEFYDNAPDLWSARDIAVAAGRTSAGHDVRLGAESTIAGRLTTAGGQAVDATVTAYRRSSDGVFREVGTSWVRNADTGRYVMAGLKAGTYRLEFTPRTPGLASEFWGDAGTLTRATDIVIGTEEQVGGVDAVLTRSGPTVFIDNTVLPSVPDPVVGRPVTADAGSWDPSDITLAYQWLVDGTVVRGATGATYTPIPGHRGKRLAVRVTATRPGSAAVTAVSGPSAPIVSPITSTAPPQVTGTAQVGGVLNASRGSWSPVAVTTTHQWLADGVDIAGATGASYTPRSVDGGTRIAVRVTASREGWASTSVVSAQTLPVLRIIRNTAAPTVSGTPVVGGRLTASGGSWSPVVVSRSYQWLAAGTEIAGATASSYTPVASDVGKSVSVRVTVTRSGYAPSSVTSGASGPVVR